MNLSDFIVSIFEDYFPLIIIQPWQRGVCTCCGHWMRELKPGVYFRFPFLEEIAIIEVTVEPVDIRCATAITSDGKDLAIGGAVVYQVDDVVKMYSRNQDIDSLIEVLVLGIIHEHVNKHTFEECKKTYELKQKIAERLKRMASQKWGLKVLDVYITDTGTKYTRHITGGEGLVNIDIGEE